MAYVNNENMWNPRYVAYVRRFFRFLLLFVLFTVQLVNRKQLSTVKQMMLQDA